MEYGLYGNPNNIIKIPVSIKIYYFVPDYNSLIQEFWWQTLDIPPYYYRIHKFLNYWKTNIEATIKDIEISSNYKPLQITIADYLLNIKN
jgi:uncharacterized protein Usg